MPKRPSTIERAAPAGRDVARPSFRRRRDERRDARRRRPAAALAAIAAKDDGRRRKTIAAASARRRTHRRRCCPGRRAPGRRRRARPPLPGRPRPRRGPRAPSAARPARPSRRRAGRRCASDGRERRRSGHARIIGRGAAMHAAGAGARRVDKGRARRYTSGPAPPAGTASSGHRADRPVATHRSHRPRHSRPRHRRTSMKLYPQALFRARRRRVRAHRACAGAHRHAQEGQGHRRDHDRLPRVVDPVFLPRRQAAADRLRDGPLHEGRRRGQGRAQDAEPQGQPAAGDVGATGSRCCRPATIDLECGSTTNSVERQKQVSFGPTYFVINVTAAVKKNSRHQEPRRPQRQDDLDDVGHDVGAAAQASTTRRRTPTSRRSTARTTRSRSCCCRRTARRRS